MQSVCQKYNPIVDLWENNATYAGPARWSNGTAYEEFIFRDRVLDIIASHDAAQPLFLLYTPHVAHCPLQVPADWLAKFNFSNDEAACAAQTPYIFPGSGAGDFRCRAQYHAMVSLLDEVLGNITDALKARGLWDDTLMVRLAARRARRGGAGVPHPLRRLRGGGGGGGGGGAVVVSPKIRRFFSPPPPPNFCPPLRRPRRFLPATMAAQATLSSRAPTTGRCEAASTRTLRAASALPPLSAAVSCPRRRAAP